MKVNRDILIQTSKPSFVVHTKQGDLHLAEEKQYQNTELKSQVQTAALTQHTNMKFTVIVQLEKFQKYHK